jgi:ABC-2 type transport system ATP-binding protein
MLVLQNLIKKYQKNNLLSIPEFYLENGIYWLKGANGSGKSTLLKIIAGLVPFTGDVLYQGVFLKKQPVVYKRQVSYHPAEANLPVFISGLELIRFYDAIKNPQQKPETDAIMNQFALHDFVHNKTGSYSSGMQKRLSLALAFIGNPKLILLDEPFSTLDTAITPLITGLIAQKNATGTGFIITSHQDFEYKNLDFTGVLEIENSLLKKRF